MPIRLSGMVSGLDTDAIVQGLSSAYQVKIDKKTKSKKKTEWQMEAWSTLNSKIYSFYTGKLSKFKTYGNYKSKKATVTGGTEGAATVTANSNAVAGSYKLKVKSAASAAFLTGAKLSASSNNAFVANYKAANATTFKEMYQNGSDTSIGDSLVGKSISFSAVYNKTDDDGNPTTETKDFTYTFTDASSVTDINKQLKDNGITGITATMKDGKLSFSNDAGFSVNDDGSLKAANAEFSVSSTDGALSTLGFASDSLNVNVNSIAEVITDDEGNEHTTYKMNQNVSSANDFGYKVNRTTLEKTTTMKDYMSDLFANPANYQTETTTNEDGTTSSRKYVEYNFKVGEETQTLKIYEDSTIDDFAKSIQTASKGKVNAGFDATNQRFFLTSTESGADNDFSFEALGDASKTALEKLGLMESTMYSGESGMVKQNATDAVIEVNGATIRSASNDINLSALGLKINVASAPAVNMDNDPTNDETMTISVSNDTDTVYNMVKDFVKEYNELLTTLSEQYYADKTTYEPLTEDEEAAMTDTQIDKWETKAKSALLRRDATVGNIMESMRNALAGTASFKNSEGVDVKKSLSSFGISTGAWTEHGLLHIYGDSDDEIYSGKENKLKQAIEEDPDAVMNTLAKLGQGLYDKLGDMMKKTSLSSTQTIYNDKSMKSQMSDYDDEIEKLQEKLEAIQNKYYKQFTAMEKSLSKLQSVSTSMGFSTGTGA